MTDQSGGLLGHQRLLARLAELFGILALLLASVGLYGVTSYTVARRTAEIGIRSALGATRRRIVGLILRGALTQIVIGVALGIGSALAAGRILADQLYNAKSSDPWILILACLTVPACATAAALIPALRASAVDPGATLRA